MNPARLTWLGVAIVLAGFLVVAVGAAIGSGGSSSGGGFIIIGPIPIVFGSGPNSGMLAEVAVVITIAMVVVYLLSFFLWRSGRRGEAGTESGKSYLFPAFHNLTDEKNPTRRSDYCGYRSRVLLRPFSSYDISKFW